MHDTALWQETELIPTALERTLEAAHGLDDALALVRSSGARRIVVTGNGAAYYGGLTLWLAALAHPSDRVEVVAVPAGLLAAGAVALRPDDLLLAISSSGKQRDLVRYLDGLDRRPAVVALTADADAPVPRRADVVLLHETIREDAAAHTQSVANAAAVLLRLWGRLSGHAAVEEAALAAPDVARTEIARAFDWLPDELTVPRAATVFGTGVAWSAAAEGALLLKEVAGVPAEGFETREGGSTGMYVLDRRDLAVALCGADDALAAEAAETCAGQGAAVVRTAPLAGGPLLAPIAAFPATAALALRLGSAAGRNVDDPEWLAAYEATMREQP